MENSTVQQYHFCLLSLLDRVLNLGLKPLSGIDVDDGVRIAVKLRMMINTVLEETDETSREF